MRSFREGDTVKVVVNIRAQPREYGLHIHEKGTAPLRMPHLRDRTNPHKMDHGDSEQGPRHAGDLGNITVGADGTASRSDTKGITVTAGDSSVLGRAIVLHEKADDLRTQPGNSGARIGCGVITGK